MSTLDHTKIEELLAAKALGGLDDADLEELHREQASHGPDCPECRELESAFGEVGGRLAFALDPEPVREDLAEEIVATSTRPGTRTRLDVTRWRRAVAGLAAAAVLVVAGGVGGYLVRGGPASQRVVRLAPSGGTGALAFVYQPGGRSAYLIASGLAPPPSNHVYELWVIKGTKPVAAGTFGAGASQVVLPVRVDLSGGSEVAVTVEPAPGSPAPTTQPVFSAPISV